MIWYSMPTENGFGERRAEGSVEGAWQTSAPGSVARWLSVYRVRLAVSTAYANASVVPEYRLHYTPVYPPYHPH